jgi:hypothetical protein
MEGNADQSVRWNVCREASEAVNAVVGSRYQPRSLPGL